MIAVTTNSKDKATSDLLQQIEALKAELAKAKEAKHRSLSLKVSAKGAVSVYGMGRFPLTLYSGQWLKLFGMVDDIKAFIEANKDKLATKD
jgi:hypothetical protein